MRTVLVQCCLALSLLGAGGQSGAGGSGELAPDGQRGFGSEPELSDLLSVMRSSRDQDRKFLDDLNGLSSELRLFFAASAEDYRARGYFEILGSKRSADLAALHAAWEASAGDRWTLLRRGGAEGRALAAMILDPRFQVRAELHANLARESSDVSGGLAVLEGTAKSFVTLTREEARAVAQRIDVAASRLRAMRSDLMALRSTAPKVPYKNDPDVAALLEAADGSDVDESKARVGEIVARAFERTEYMRSALFSTRLDARLGTYLQWRQRSLEEAATQLARALVYLPGTPESEAASDEVRALKKHERMRWAGYSARAGLAEDPLDARLAFIAARAADFQWGTLESRALYDRFLFLRGIRHFDHRTLKDRKLDEWEQEALVAVQRPAEFERPPPTKE